MALGEPGDVVNDRGAADLDPAVVTVGGLGEVVGLRTPPGSRRNRLSNGSLARPNSAMSTQVSAPESVAASAITSISNSWCRRALPRLGSPRSPRHARNRSMPPLPCNQDGKIRSIFSHKQIQRISCAIPLELRTSEDMTSRACAGGPTGEAASINQECTMVWLKVEASLLSAGISGIVALATPANALPAFPGAEGAGSEAQGGRGGAVFIVDSLADGGPGTLRECIIGNSYIAGLSTAVKNRRPYGVNVYDVTGAPQEIYLEDNYGEGMPADAIFDVLDRTMRAWSAALRWARSGHGCCRPMKPTITSSRRQEHGRGTSPISGSWPTSTRAPVASSIIRTRWAAGLCSRARWDRPTATATACRILVL